MGVLDGVRALDVYKKLPRDLSESTLAGALLTAAAAFAVAFLVGGETRAFLAPQAATSIVVDKSLNGDVLPVNFAISFPELACEFATLDVSNALGSHRLNVDGVSTLGSKTVRKTRLLADGSDGDRYVDRLSPIFRQSDPAYTKLELKLAEAAADEDGTADYIYEDEDIVDQVLDEHSFELTPETYDRGTKSAPLVIVAFMAKWCAWCKMLLPIWEHTAGIVKQKYGDEKVLIAHVDCVDHAKFCAQQGIQGFPGIRVHRLDGASRKHEMYMGDRTTDGITKFIDGIIGSSATSDDGKTDRKKRSALAQLSKYDTRAVGCRLDGYLLVKKVPGTIELGAHAVGHSFSNAHLNLSHVVHHLSFGHALTEDDKAEVRSLVRGPDGGEWQEWSARFLDTPFTARTDNVTFEHYVNVVLQTVEKGDFSIDLYDTTAHSHQYESAEQSAVRISFVPSPFQVVIDEKRQPLADYLTNLMAIVGGCFTLASLLDKLVWGTQQAIKASMGKQY